MDLMTFGVSFHRIFFYVLMLRGHQSGNSRILYLSLPLHVCTYICRYLHKYVFSLLEKPSKDTHVVIRLILSEVKCVLDFFRQIYSSALKTDRKFGFYIWTCRFQNRIAPMLGMGMIKYSN
jgi:hypothetical protein